MCPCWIGTQRINITRHTLHPAEPQGHQEHVTGLNDVCCHGNAANNTGVSYEQAYERQKNKKILKHSATWVKFKQCNCSHAQKWLERVIKEVYWALFHFSETATKICISFPFMLPLHFAQENISILILMIHLNVWFESEFVVAVCNDHRSSLTTIKCTTDFAVEYGEVSSPKATRVTASCQVPCLLSCLI